MSRYLAEIQRVPASGARCVSWFQVGGEDYLAVGQMAYDAPGTPTGMNGGTSNTDVLLFKRDGEQWALSGTLPGNGGEDAEFFTIDGRHFLAIASIRSGSGPYNFNQGQPIYVWEDDHFEPFQTIVGYAGKQWRHFTADGQHFLALAQNRPGKRDVPSHVFRWDGEKFQPFQDIPSRGGYNFEAFEIDGVTYLAHADHARPGELYRWTGNRFVHHQDLGEVGGRAYALLRDDTGVYLAVANIREESTLLRWDGEEFVDHQVLDGGDGGREFTVIESDQGTFVVRVNFVAGGPQNPQPLMKSQVYRFAGGKLEVVQEFDTCGACDVTHFPLPGGGIGVATSSGLNARVGFASESSIYRFDPEGKL
ncbi:hypothetical protein [Kutzneria sp. NPDC052558]|uniref:hypothetical protein n=1 Tax=Kutzneria sp. NPDC052558 TaxID=3364121 RepID=UPI0037C6069B